MHPNLRDDLELHPASAAFDGSPQWTIHDPIRNLFFSVDWMTFEFLSRWHLGDSKKIIDAIIQETTLSVDQEDYEHIFKFLLENELLLISGDDAFNYLVQRSQTKKSGIILWLIHNYLFFRIPLVKVDAWLTRNAHKADIFYSSLFLKLSIAVGLWGLLSIYKQFDEFSTSFLDFLSWQGAAAYFLALIFIKFIHEMAHAFTAKRLGCNVPTMGIAFLVMMPLAYTDTNDVWKLKDRHERLLVDIAGVISELLIAGWAIFLWGFLPPGLIKNVLYVLATTSWINTILINLSPFMRFDGYYALADYLGIANLHTRASEIAKWHFRRYVFALDHPIPEKFPKSIETFLIIFAWITAIYRLTVFLSIAFLVYHFFIKAVGIVLFLIEIIWFILKPIYTEIQFWIKSKEEIAMHSNKNRLFILISIILFLLTFPLDFRLKEMGVLKPKLRYQIVINKPTKIQSLPPSNGQFFSKEEGILNLHSLDLSRQLLIAKNEQVLNEWKVGRASFNKTLQANLPANSELYGMSKKDLEALEHEEALLNITAPFSGKYYELTPDVTEGDWVGRGARLGVLINPEQWVVEAYIPEEDIHRVKVGAGGKFFPETAGNEVLKIRVVSIDPSPIQIIPDTIYATQTGGNVISRIVDEKVVADRPYYRILMEVKKSPSVQVTQRGNIFIYTQPESFMSKFIRSSVVGLRKEMSF